MKVNNQNRLRDYSTLFSRSEILSLKNGNFHSIIQKVNRYDKEWLSLGNNTFKDYLKYVYRILEENYINEYVVKNSFLTQQLIPEMKCGDAVIFNEFRLRQSVADLAIFNGTSKVFEIKTEYDSASRLEIQIADYKKIFNQVYLIIPESKIRTYQKLGLPVGIITYSPKKPTQFTTHDASPVILNPEPNEIMNILHTNEYKAIIEKHYGDLPKMTSFKQFQICKDLLIQIPAEKLNKLFIEQMKKRQMSTGLSIRHLKELNQITLALKLTKNEKQSLLNNLNSIITTL